jgi:Pyruvate/2-oxoacid:ferredoxin oxidoreductase gamma subunit
VEREIMLTGIGGQGVQLAAQVLARGAATEGRNVMLFGVYGGMMRGGNTDSSVVVADGPIQAPPLLSQTWGALLMHHKYWEPMAHKIRDGGIVLANSSLFEGDLERDRYRVIDIAATDAATALGAPLTASMVLTGAFVAATGLVGIDAIVQAMTDSLPPYRRQHAEANERALRHGYALVDEQIAPAWEGVAA